MGVKQIIVRVAAWLGSLDFLLPVIAIGAGVAVLSFVLSATGRLPNTSSPLVYTTDRIDLPNPVICAGDSISFIEAYKVSDAPERVDKYFELRNLDTGDTPRKATEPTDNTLTIPRDVGKVLTTPVVFSDTVGLPAGHYELVRFGKADGREGSFYGVLLEIKPCP